MGAKHSVNAGDVLQLRSNPSSFFSLLPPELTAILVAFLRADSPVLGLGRCLYPCDHPHLATAASFRNISVSWEPGYSPVTLAATPPDDEVLLSSNEYIFTQRGVATHTGFYSYSELAMCPIVKVAPTNGRPFDEPMWCFGNAVVLANPKLREALAQICHQQPPPPRGLLPPSSFAEAAKWLASPADECARLWQRLGPCGADATLRTGRRAVAIRRLARDLSARPIYPCLPRSMLIQTLQACRLSSDEGVILVQQFQSFSGMPMIHLCITEMHLIWHAATATYALPFETLRRGSARCEHVHHRADHDTLTLRWRSDEGETVRVLDVCNARPRPGSEKWISLLTILLELLTSEPMNQ